MSLQEQITKMHLCVSEKDRLNIPLFAINPSRCVRFMNLISVSDLFDEVEIFRVKDDLIELCQAYGEVTALEIPRPLGSRNPYTYSYGVGKLFVKFESITNAKQARYRISGR